MKHLKAINAKAARMEGELEAGKMDVLALQEQRAAQKPPHVPVGCSTAFFPGWEVDSSGGTAGLCQPAERDLYDCYADCFWPAQVPDQLNRYPDWSKKCAAATQDWRNLDVVFP